MPRHSTSGVAIFLHIPRTAGTTLQRIIERHYRARELYRLGPVAQADLARFNALPSWRRASYRMITGHLAFGRPENVEGPVTWVTLLREPVDRSVSFFHYVRNHAQHYLHTSIAPGDNLVTFLESKQPLMMDNAQTRMVSGAWLEPPFGACTEAMLEKAKEHLATDFAVVGLTEQFDASLLLFRKQFGWPWLNYRRHNITSSRPAAERLPAAERRALEETNQLDLRLYAFAKRLFEERVRCGGPDFAADLEAFQSTNRPYPAVLDLWWRLRSRSPVSMVRSAWSRLRTRPAGTREGSRPPS